MNNDKRKNMINMNRSMYILDVTKLPSIDFITQISVIISMIQLLCYIAKYVTAMGMLSGSN